MAYVCRLCLEKSNAEDYLMLTQQIMKMIHFCVPEFKSKITLNPLLCKQCHKALETMYTFKSKIIEVQEKIIDLVKQKEGNMIINLDALLESESTNKTTEASPAQMDVDVSSDGGSENERTRETSMQEEDVLTDVNNTLSRINDDNDELLNLLNGIIEPEVDTLKPVEHEKSKSGNVEIAAAVKTKTSPTKTNKKSPEKLNVNKSAYNCFSCRHRFKTFPDLIDHECKNHSVGKYKCSLCAFQCISPNASILYRHYINLHKQVTSFTSTCIFCNYSSDNMKKLGDHLKQKHTTVFENNKYSCDLCLYTTQAYRKFIRHYCQKHTGTCYACKVKLKPRQLNEHLRIHYEDGAVQCASCAKVCLGYYRLEQHMKTHVKVQAET